MEVVSLRTRKHVAQDAIEKMLEDTLALVRQGRVKAAGLALIMADDLAQTMYRNNGQSVAPLIGAAMILANQINTDADTMPAEVPEDPPPA